MNEASAPDKDRDESLDGVIDIPIETADGEMISDLDAPDAAASDAETSGADAPDTESSGPEVAAADDDDAEADDVDAQPVVATSKLSEAIAELQQEKQQTYDRLLRMAAEFENFKKRAKRDQREASERSEDRVVMACLPVIDNLERALEHGESEMSEAEAGIASGVRMVHKQFVGILGQFGIEGFDSMGEPFDPELHEAVQQMPSELPKNAVMTELQRGYKRKGKLVRPAMVVVSKGGAEPPAPVSEEGPEEDSGDAADDTSGVVDVADSDASSESES
jgi:molecular chaperone GrpE